MPRDGRPWLLCGLPLGRLRAEKGGGYRSAQRQETNQRFRSSMIISKSNNAESRHWEFDE